MDHLSYSIRRLLAKNREGKQTQKDFDGPVIRMSDLNTSNTDSVKNLKTSKIKKEKTKTPKLKKQKSDGSEKRKIDLRQREEETKKLTEHRTNPKDELAENAKLTDNSKQNANDVKQKEGVRLIDNLKQNANEIKLKEGARLCDNLKQNSNEVEREGGARLTDNSKQNANKVEPEGSARLADNSKQNANDVEKGEVTKLAEDNIQKGEITAENSTSLERRQKEEMTKLTETLNELDLRKFVEDLSNAEFQEGGNKQEFLADYFNMELESFQYLFGGNRITNNVGNKSDDLSKAANCSGDNMSKEGFLKEVLNNSKRTTNSKEIDDFLENSSYNEDEFATKDFEKRRDEKLLKNEDYYINLDSTRNLQQQNCKMESCSQKPVEVNFKKKRNELIHAEVHGDNFKTESCKRKNELIDAEVHENNFKKDCYKRKNEFINTEVHEDDFEMESHERKNQLIEAEVHEDDYKKESQQIHEDRIETETHKRKINLINAEVQEDDFNKKSDKRKKQLSNAEAREDSKRGFYLNFEIEGVSKIVDNQQNLLLGTVMCEDFDKRHNKVCKFDEEYFIYGRNKFIEEQNEESRRNETFVTQRNILETAENIYCSPQASQNSQNIRTIDNEEECFFETNSKEEFLEYKQFPLNVNKSSTLERSTKKEKITYSSNPNISSKKVCVVKMKIVGPKRKKISVDVESSLKQSKNEESFSENENSVKINEVSLNLAGINREASINKSFYVGDGYSLDDALKFHQVDSDFKENKKGYKNVEVEISLRSNLNKSEIQQGNEVRGITDGIKDLGRDCLEDVEDARKLRNEKDEEHQHNFEDMEISTKHNDSKISKASNKYAEPNHASLSNKQNSNEEYVKNKQNSNEECVKNKHNSNEEYVKNKQNSNEEYVKNKQNLNEEYAKNKQNSNEEYVKNKQNPIEDILKIKPNSDEDVLKIKTNSNEDHLKTKPNSDEEPLKIRSNADKDVVKNKPNPHDRLLKIKSNPDEDLSKIKPNPHEGLLKIQLNSDEDLFKNPPNPDEELLEIKLNSNEDFFKNKPNSDQRYLTINPNRDEDLLEIKLKADEDVLKNKQNSDEEILKNNRNSEEDILKNKQNSDEDLLKIIHHASIVEENVEEDHSSLLNIPIGDSSQTRKFIVDIFENGREEMGIDSDDNAQTSDFEYLNTKKKVYEDKKGEISSTTENESKINGFDVKKKVSQNDRFLEEFKDYVNSTIGAEYGNEENAFTDTEEKVFRDTEENAFMDREEKALPEENAFKDIEENAFTDGEKEEALTKENAFTDRGEKAFTEENVFKNIEENAFTEGEKEKALSEENAFRDTEENAFTDTEENGFTDREEEEAHTKENAFMVREEKALTEENVFRDIEKNVFMDREEKAFTKENAFTDREEKALTEENVFTDIEENAFTGTQKSDRINSNSYRMEEHGIEYDFNKNPELITDLEEVKTENEEFHLYENISTETDLLSNRKFYEESIQQMQNEDSVSESFAQQEEIKSKLEKEEHRNKNFDSKSSSITKNSQSINEEMHRYPSTMEETKSKSSSATNNWQSINEEMHRYPLTMEEILKEDDYSSGLLALLASERDPKMRALIASEIDDHLKFKMWDLIEEAKLSKGDSMKIDQQEIEDTSNSKEKSVKIDPRIIEEKNTSNSKGKSMKNDSRIVEVKNASNWKEKSMKIDSRLIKEKNKSNSKGDSIKIDQQNFEDKNAFNLKGNSKEINRQKIEEKNSQLFEEERRSIESKCNDYSQKNAINSKLIKQEEFQRIQKNYGINSSCNDEDFVEERIEDDHVKNSKCGGNDSIEWKCVKNVKFSKEERNVENIRSNSKYDDERRIEENCTINSKYYEEEWTKENLKTNLKYDEGRVEENHTINSKYDEEGRIKEDLTTNLKYDEEQRIEENYANNIKYNEEQRIEGNYANNIKYDEEQRIEENHTINSKYDKEEGMKENLLTNLKYDEGQRIEENYATNLKYYKEETSEENHTNILISGKNPICIEEECISIETDLSNRKLEEEHFVKKEAMKKRNYFIREDSVKKSFARQEETKSESFRNEVKNFTISRNHRSFEEDIRNGNANTKEFVIKIDLPTETNSNRNRRVSDSSGEVNFEYNTLKDFIGGVKAPQSSVKFEILKSPIVRLKNPKTTHISTKTIEISDTNEFSKNFKIISHPDSKITTNDCSLNTINPTLEEGVMGNETKEFAEKRNSKNISVEKEKIKELDYKNCFENSSRQNFNEAVKNKAVNEFDSKSPHRNNNDETRQGKTYQEFRKRQNLRFYKELTKHADFKMNDDLISAVLKTRANDENFMKFMRKTEPNEEDFILEEERIRKLINRSSNYKPLMGKNALLAKARMEKSDSEIVQELVMQRFSNFLDQYYQRSFQRQSSRQQRSELEESDQTCENNFQNFNEDCFENVTSSTPTGSAKSLRRESGEFVRFSVPIDDFSNIVEGLATPRGSKDCGCRPVKGCFGLKLKSVNKCCCAAENLNRLSEDLSRNQRLEGESSGNALKKEKTIPQSPKYELNLENANKEGIFPGKSQVVLRQHPRGMNRPRSFETSNNTISSNNPTKANRHSGIIESNFDIFENSYENFEPQNFNINNETFIENPSKTMKYSDFHKRSDNTNSNLSHLIKQFEKYEINNDDEARGKPSFEDSNLNSLQRKRENCSSKHSESKCNKNGVLLETNFDHEFLNEETSNGHRRNVSSIKQSNGKSFKYDSNAEVNNKSSHTILNPQENKKTFDFILDIEENNKSSNFNSNLQGNNKSSNVCHLTSSHLRPEENTISTYLSPEVNRISSHLHPEVNKVSSHLRPEVNNISSHLHPEVNKISSHLKSEVNNTASSPHPHENNKSSIASSDLQKNPQLETRLNKKSQKPFYLHERDDIKTNVEKNGLCEKSKNEEFIDFEPSFQSTIARSSRSGSRKSLEMTSSNNSLKNAPRKFLTVKVTEIDGSLESMQGLPSKKSCEREGIFLDQEDNIKNTSNSTLTITDSLELDFKIDDLNLDFLKSTDEQNIETSYEVLEKKPDETNFDDSSDRVSYDAHKFLRDALGDELKAYLSTDSHLLSDLDLSENPSIGTSNISDLLSKASSYGVVQNDRAIRRTSTIYEENHYSQSEYTDYISNDKKLADLILETNVQNQILAQTHKALTLCRRTKEFMASIEEIEAERILLIATLKREALKEEIHRMEYEDLSDSPYKNTGCVRIKGITFPPKPRNSYMPNLFDKRRKEFTHWFVSVLKSGSTVFATKPVIPDNDGMVKFDEEFIFNNLSPDFNITVGIYVIKIKNNVRNYSHESKFHLNKEVKTLCPSPSKLFNLSRESKTRIQEDASPSSFTLSGKCMLGINNLKDLGYFKLTDVPLVSMLEGTVVINFITSVTMNEEFSDFLNVGSETGEFITWNRRWCSIKGAHLFYYNYPEDEEPVGKLDLSYCITSYITSAERTICARPRTLFLETAVKGTSEHSPKVSRHFLAADSVNQMKVWETKLNHTVSALRNWNCMKCNFVFSKV